MKATVKTTRLACAHGPATARHFQDWARSSRQPPTDRAWERAAPARSLYLVRNDSCGIWRGNRCSQGRAFCAPSTEHAARAVDTEASVRFPVATEAGSPPSIIARCSRGVVPPVCDATRLLRLQLDLIQALDK